MKTIAMIGAGSVIFGKNILADILWHDALKESEFRLMDIDPDRLATAGRMAQLINRDLKAGARIICTDRRRKALDGADFVICTMGVGGFEATLTDHAVPRRFGVRQTVGDTLGVGGIFRAVRGVPELLRLCEEMRRLCPRALLINYSNPMAMHCLAVERATRIRHVGLCHGVQNTARVMRMYVALCENRVPPQDLERHLARPRNSRIRFQEWMDWMALGLDPRLNYLCAGINHLAFFLQFRSGQRDLYPALRRAGQLAHLRRLDPVRFELFSQIGYYMTETSGHIAEYVPYYLNKTAEIRAKELRPSVYVQACRDLERNYRALRAAARAGRSLIRIPYQPSNEHVSRVIHAMVTGQPYRFNGNVHNAGGRLISNVQGNACVEAPCLAGRSGIAPQPVGDLPPACAALIRTNINVQDLAVRGILEGNRDFIRQALLLDPNTASQIPPSAIAGMVEAMFKAQARWLPRNLR